MTKSTDTQPTRRIDVESCDRETNPRDGAYMKSHVLVDLASKCYEEFGDFHWSSVGTTGSYIKGSDKVFKVLIEDSQTPLKSGLVAVDSALQDEEDTPLTGKEEAGHALFVVPRNGKPTVYVWDIDLLRHVCQEHAVCYQAPSGQGGEHHALPVSILKSCAMDSFTFESEFYDRLLASGAQEAHA
jgi:hypothetical protein